MAMPIPRHRALGKFASEVSESKKEEHGERREKKREKEERKQGGILRRCRFRSEKTTQVSPLFFSLFSSFFSVLCAPLFSPA
jgi:hypothetical protein